MEYSYYYYYYYVSLSTLCSITYFNKSVIKESRPRANSCNVQINENNADDYKNSLANSQAANEQQKLNEPYPLGLYQQMTSKLQLQQRFFLRYFSLNEIDQGVYRHFGRPSYLFSFNVRK